MNAILPALVQAGILPQNDADRIDRSLSPEAARLHAEQLLEQAFQRGLSAQQRRLLNTVMDAQGTPTAAQMNRVWQSEDELLWASVGDEILDVAGERAVVASINPGTSVDADTWMKINQETVDFAENYYTSAAANNLGSIPNLNQTTRQIVGNAIADWQQGDRTPGNARAGLPQLIAELQPAFGAKRAKTIAITEVSRVFSMAELQAARSNEFVTSLIWETGRDEFVCKICGPRHGTVVGKETNGFRLATDSFVGFPPAHPNCRCALSSVTGPALEALEAEGMVAPPPEPVTVGATVRNRITATNTDFVQRTTTAEARIQEIDAQIESAGTIYNARSEGFVPSEERQALAVDYWGKVHSLQGEREKLLQIVEDSKAEMRSNALRQLALPELQQSKIVVDSSGLKGRRGVKEMRANADEAVAFVNRITANAETVVDFEYDEFGRAYQQGGTIYISATDDTKTIAHEFGHAIERIRGSEARSQRVAFVERRTAGRGTVRTKSGEIAHDGGFLDVYAGKIMQQDTDRTPSSEIVSMGIQWLYDDPQRLIDKDPDYFDFIVSYLRGK